MKTLYLDCFSGISGDMTVGTLRDLGVEEAVFHKAVSALGLNAEFTAHFQRGSRQGISGWKFEVTLHPHFQAVDPKASLLLTTPGHVHGRSFRTIRSLIEASALSPFIKKHAVGTFSRIAVAEGRIHGQPPEEVAFHEVGAVDSLVDIVAACAGFEAIGADQILASRLVEGNGWVDCAHGRFPLPAPATLEILHGLPLRQIDEPRELITPTGAALVAEFATGFGPLPEMRVEKTGYGLATRDSAPRPNVLRTVLGQSLDSHNADTDEVIQIECNLDDSTPELAGAAMERLLAAGALDVFFTAAQMKKNRPGVTISVIAPIPNKEAIAHVLLRESSSIGVRMHECERRTLERKTCVVETQWGPVKGKVCWGHGVEPRFSPEYDSAKQIHDEHDIPMSRIYQEAARVYGAKSTSKDD